MKRFTIVAVFLIAASLVSAQVLHRKKILMPDLPGYISLSCDLHTHTVFSDGMVWPDVRVYEAYNEGLDAIAITDHLEYQPHDKYIDTNHNDAYNIAFQSAKALGIILIAGVEITRRMPPGHFNAIFIQDVEKMDTAKYLDAMQEAKNQGGFLFWNHPGYQHDDGIPVWYKEHDTIFDRGFMQGIEVANMYNYYPLAHQWAIEKNLTMLANSDVHSPIGLSWNASLGQHRPFNIVFAKEKSQEGIKEALMNGRTIVWYEDKLIGKKEFLEQFFLLSLKIKPLEDLPVKKSRSVSSYLQITNMSGFDYQIEFSTGGELVTWGRETLEKETETAVFVRPAKGIKSGKHEIRLKIKVTNLIVAPDQCLETELVFQAEVVE
ncbi:MAG: PHP domain-containing protein [Bacteroidetes bacterium]|nr:PHP domain-containing protein [Bacteroidota bacterium]MBU1720659.1 PHP domain-containing protein [Bacteroidota bacterium]